MRLVSRADCLTTALVASACVMPLSPRRAVAYDLQTAIALAPLVQFSAAVDDIDAFLFSGLLEQRPPSGIQKEQGATACKLVKQLLREGRAREAAREAAAVAVKARVLTTPAAAEVERRAREAEERLAAIVETDAIDGLKRDQLNKELLSMRPEQLRFYHRALTSARSELGLACACFGADERRAALGLAAGASTADSVGATAYTERSAAERLAARDARILAAIDQLPEVKGSALRRASSPRRPHDRSSL